MEWIEIGCKLTAMFSCEIVNKVQSEACAKENSACRCHLTITCRPLHNEFANLKEMSDLMIRNEAKKNMFMVKIIFYRFLET